MIAKKSLPLALLGLTLALAGCGDDNDGGAPDLRGAWSDYQAGDWSSAEAAFLEAVDDHPDAAEAWCGLGYSRAARQTDGGPKLDEGVLDAFQRADRLRGGYVDAWAGLAEYHSAADHPLAAAEWALDAAESGGAAYQFTHNPAVNHRSLRKIAAWNLFKLERYPEAGAQVRIIVPGFVYNQDADSLARLLEGIGNL